METSVDLRKRKALLIAQIKRPLGLRYPFDDFERYRMLLPFIIDQGIEIDVPGLGDC